MIDSFDDNCKPFFNFRREDLHRILPLLRFPETCELGYRHKMSGEEVLLRGLYELSSGDEQHDIAVNIFGRDQSVPSRAFKCFINHIYDNHHHLVNNNLHWWKRNGFWRFVLMLSGVRSTVTVSTLVA